MFVFPVAFVPVPIAIVVVVPVFIIPVVVGPVVFSHNGGRSGNEGSQSQERKKYLFHSVSDAPERPFIRDSPCPEYAVGVCPDRPRGRIRNFEVT
jgi:hypothetical protein